jgi:beta-glucosidase-like glycosyl hydrolase
LASKEKMSREDNYRDFFQLLSVGLEGPRLTEEEKIALREYPPSGIILFERNVEDAGQLGTLVSEVRDIIIESSGFAPLIMADHEGGRISVLAAALGVPPPQMAIAAGRNRKKRKDVYRETARRIKSCGINLVLSPLGDINSEYLNPIIGTRAFGSDCGEVSELVYEAVETYREEGILTCLKHFPGHGLTIEDSHLTLPVVPITLDKFEERELLPFAAGIKAGAELVMTAHIRPLDRDLPASMDSAVVKDMLRGKLSFEGVIITDALEMKGASQLAEGEDGRADLESLAGQALSAGNDILLFSRPLCEIVTEMNSVFGSSHREDDILFDGFRKLHTKAARKILKLREKTVDFIPKNSVSLSKIDSPNFQTRAYTNLAVDSVQVIIDPGRVLPLSSESFLSFRFIGERSDFYSVAVKMYILRILRDNKSFSRECPAFDVKKNMDLLNELAIEDNILPVEIPGVRGTGKNPLFFEFAFKTKRKNYKEVLFLLCRKPVSKDLITAMSVKSDIIVVSDWPYSVNLVSEQKTVIITRGIFSAAAAVVNNLLYGENEKC